MKAMRKLLRQVGIFISIIILCMYPIVGFAYPDVELYTENDPMLTWHPTDGYLQYLSKLAECRQELLEAGCQEKYLDFCSRVLYAIDMQSGFDYEKIDREQTILSNYLSRRSVIYFGCTGTGINVINFRDAAGNDTGIPAICYVNTQQTDKGMTALEAAIIQLERFSPNFLDALTENGVCVVLQNFSKKETGFIARAADGVIYLPKEIDNNFVLAYPLARGMYENQYSLLFCNTPAFNPSVKQIMKLYLAGTCYRYLLYTNPPDIGELHINILETSIEYLFPDALSGGRIIVDLLDSQLSSMKEHLEVIPFGASSWDEIDTVVNYHMFARKELCRLSQIIDFRLIKDEASRVLCSQLLQSQNEAFDIPMENAPNQISHLRDYVTKLDLMIPDVRSRLIINKFSDIHFYISDNHAKTPITQALSKIERDMPDARGILKANGFMGFIILPSDAASATQKSWHDIQHGMLLLQGYTKNDELTEVVYNSLLDYAKQHMNPPVVHSISIFLGKEYVVGKSVTIDFSDAVQMPYVFSAVTAPEGTLPYVYWESLSPDVAIIDYRGHLVCLSNGRATIRATATDGMQMCASFIVDVKNMNVPDN